MPPDAYNQIINQTNSTNHLNSNQSIAARTTVANQVPVQNLIKNLQTNLGSPLVLSSGIKVIPNQQLLTVTNPQTVLTTANMLPFNHLNQFANKNANLRIVTTNQQQAGQQIKQIQLPFIIKSIVNPILPQQTGCLTTQASLLTTNSIAKVNPISSVKAPVPLASKKVTPEKLASSSKSSKQLAKQKVSFNFEKNTSTSIKPITNNLPLAASNVLLTSTPKQSIIKKPKVFELPCTPIVNSLATNKKIATRTTVVAKGNVQQPISQQIKNKIEIVKNNSYSKNEQQQQQQQQQGIAIKYCKANQCSCMSSIPKDDLEHVKKEFKNLNAPKKMLYVYCSTIKINDDAKFDFEKYVFYVRTKRGFQQVCHRVFMEIFDKNNLTFVESAFKKFNV